MSNDVAGVRVALPCWPVANPLLPSLPPPHAASQPPGSLAASWTTVLVIMGITITTVAGGFIAFVLYLRPVLRTAERAAAAAERAAQEMEVAAVVSSLPSCGSLLLPAC